VVADATVLDRRVYVVRIRGLSVVVARQLLPFGWLSRLFEPHVAGLERFGPTWLDVSEGTGFWGPPMCIGTSCEIAAIMLI